MGILKTIWRRIKVVTGSSSLVHTFFSLRVFLYTKSAQPEGYELPFRKKAKSSGSSYRREKRLLQRLRLHTSGSAKIVFFRVPYWRFLGLGLQTRCRLVDTLQRLPFVFSALCPPGEKKRCTSWLALRFFPRRAFLHFFVHKEWPKGESLDWGCPPVPSGRRCVGLATDWQPMVKRIEGEKFCVKEKKFDRNEYWFWSTNNNSSSRFPTLW